MTVMLWLCAIWLVVTGIIFGIRAGIEFTKGTEFGFVMSLVAALLSLLLVLGMLGSFL